MVNTKKTPVEHTQKEMGKESKHIKKKSMKCKKLSEREEKNKKATYVKKKLNGIAGS